MQVLFCELDGTTWQQELPRDMLMPEMRAPLFPGPSRYWFMESEFPDLRDRLFKTRRYQRVGISGDIAFYDRVVDVEEIR